MAKASTKAKAKKGTKSAKDKMAKVRASRGAGLGSKFSGMSAEALLKVKANTPSEDKAAHYAIRRALRAGGYKISEHRTPKAKATKGKGAAKAAVAAATRGKAKKVTKAAKKAKGKTKGGDWEDED